MLVTDVAVGLALPEQRVSVDAHSMKVFTLVMADPNPIHFDPTTTAELGLGSKLINQGTLNMAYPLNVIASWVGDASRIRSFRCRFLGSVHEGDEVVASAAVTAVDGDLVTLSVRLDRSDDCVLEGSAVVDLA